jgi:hypothetical protein
MPHESSIPETEGDLLVRAIKARMSPEHVDVIRQQLTPTHRDSLADLLNAAFAEGVHEGWRQRGDEFRQSVLRSPPERLEQEL